MTDRLAIASLGALLGVVTLLGGYLDYTPMHLPGYTMLAIGISGLIYANLRRPEAHCETDTVGHVRRSHKVFASSVVLLLSGLVWLDRTG